jgi:hypothetical protein
MKYAVMSPAVRAIKISSWDAPMIRISAACTLVAALAVIASAQRFQRFSFRVVSGKIDLHGSARGYRAGLQCRDNVTFLSRRVFCHGGIRRDGGLPAEGVPRIPAVHPVVSNTGHIRCAPHGRLARLRTIGSFLCWRKGVNEEEQYQTWRGDQRGSLPLITTKDQAIHLIQAFLL